MGRVKDHIIDMYDYPHRYSFREVANWTGYKWSFLIKQHFIQLFDCWSWRESQEQIRRIALELDF